MARRGYTAILRQLKLLTANAFRVQVENGLENNFSAFFRGFNPGLTYIAGGMQFFKSGIGGKGVARGGGVLACP